ncbi:MAG: pyruvate kinase, partial [Gaiellales bacterium]|nr:pyruvate kinase [Gaiellales bacterium]
MSAATVRRTKIVCTIGPVSSAPEFIERMAWAGMDAARLNFSHGTRDDHLAVIHGVRRAQEVIGRP